jgi:hypothetical protein
LFAGCWFIGGLLIDGWAHNHLDLSKEGFFTPYHAVFYSGYAALAATVLVATWHNKRARGVSWRAAIPYGYEATLVGLAIFAVGGLLDMTWHVLFGIEQDVEALFSPTHLLLAAGGATMLSGPIRAGVARARKRTWADAYQVLVPLAFFATLVSFFFMWAFATESSRAADPHALFPALRGDALGRMRELQMEHGIAAVVVRSLIFAGFAMWAARRMLLPFGAVAFLVGVPTVLVAAMLSPNLEFVAIQGLAALVAGVAADALLARKKLDGRLRLRAFGFVLPFAFWAAYMLAGYFVAGGFWWSPHVAYGAPVIGGMCGLLLALGTEPPA